MSKWPWPLLPEAREKRVQFRIFDPDDTFFARGCKMPLLLVLGSKSFRKPEALERREQKKKSDRHAAELGKALSKASTPAEVASAGDAALQQFAPSGRVCGSVSDWQQTEQRSAPDPPWREDGWTWPANAWQAEVRSWAGDVWQTEGRSSTAHTWDTDRRGWAADWWQPEHTGWAGDVWQNKDWHWSHDAWHSERSAWPDDDWRSQRSGWNHDWQWQPTAPWQRGDSWETAKWSPRR